MIPKNGILTLSGLLLLASVPSLFAQEPPEQVESFNLVPKKISSELLVPEAEDAPAQINLPDPDDNVTDKDFYGSDALAKAALLCAEGKPYDCAAHYKELTRSADAEESFSAYKNLGVMEYFGGRSSSAIEYLDKALSKKPSDAISNILKGWAYLSMGKNRQAIDQFNKVTSLTSNPGMVSDSRLGTALALLFDGKYKDAEKKLQALYATDPYTIAFTAYLMALANIEQGEPLTAQTYLEQSLKHDGMNYDAAKKLSTLYSDAEENLKAWQTYSTIAALEPDDPDIQNTFKKLGGKLKDDPAKFMIRTRLSSPINRLLRRTKSPELNVALYSDGNGIPARIKEFAFQASSSFTITDLTLGSISKGKRNDTWTVRFDPEKQNITVTNSWDNIEYLSGKPFRITPLGDGAGVLLKNLVGGSLIDRDYGDKEFRGELTVIPSTNGIILINNTTVEDFLPGALSPARAGTTEPETLKALAVVLRTKITNAIKVSTNPLYNFCDSRACLEYNGINTEVTDFLDAVDQTRGELVIPAKPGQSSEFFQAWANITDYGAADSEKFSTKPLSPAQIFERLTDAPPGDLLCTPSDLTQWSSVKWTQLLDSEDVSRRAKHHYKIGTIKAFEPVSRAQSGRIETAIFHTRSKDLPVNSPEGINELLAAGTLRSMFFYVIPIYNGSAIDTYIVRGLGTGHGKGMCVKGAEKAAKYDKNYREILKHYFPGSKLTDKAN